MLSALGSCMYVDIYVAMHAFNIFTPWIKGTYEDIQVM